MDTLLAHSGTPISKKKKTPLILEFPIAIIRYRYSTDLSRLLKSKYNFSSF